MQRAAGLDGDTCNELDLLNGVLYVLYDLTKSLKERVHRFIPYSAKNITPSLRDETTSPLLNCMRIRGGSPVLSLPDELMGYIFELSTDYAFAHSTRDCETAFSISHTCSPFRKVALHLPGLWTSVSNRQHPAELSAVLQRSKNAPLSVAVREENNFLSRYSKFIKTVLVHRGRWKTFLFDSILGCHEGDAAYRLAPLRRVLGHLRILSLNLPSLTTLVVKFWNPGVHDVDSDQPVHFVHFYATWKMPNLTTLRTESVVPYPPHTTVPFACDVSFQRQHCFSTFGADLKTFITQSPNLKQLSLDYLPDVDDESDVPQFERPVELPHLESLVIKGRSEASGALLKNLIMPKIREMDLYVGLLVNEDPTEDWLRTALAPGNKFEYLTKFDFAVEHDDCLEHVDLAPILERFRHLESLTITPTRPRSSVYRWYSPFPSADDLPPLRTLSLSYQDGFDLETLVERLRNGRHGDKFEKLKIQEFTLQSWRRFKEALPEGLVEWEEAF